MIFNTIIDAIAGLFTYVVGLFPDANLTIASTIQNSIYNLKIQLVPWNWAIPVDALTICIDGFIAILIAALATKLLRWILSIFTYNAIH